MVHYMIGIILVGYNSKLKQPIISGFSDLLLYLAPVSRSVPEIVIGV